jgi:polysaccharide pyruvyl transferase CsaB
VRITVAAWIGSTNAGDELIFAALRRKLLARGTRITAISTRPADTADGRVEVVDHRALVSVARAIRDCDALVFGGGGLLQDQTSSFNLPYHLSRIVVGRAVGTPFAAVGVGAGPLRTAAGRWQVRRALRGAVGIAARDQASVDLLRSFGVPGVRLSADLAFSLPVPDVAPADVICACLRPWRAARGRLPVGTRVHTDITAESMVTRLAAGLDEAAARTGLGVRLVALQRDWDDLLHQRVAQRMSCAVELAAPAPDDVLAQIAASRVVVAMRYHAAIAAMLACRPAVLIGYDPKLDGLATALGPAASLIPWDPAALTGVGQAVAAVVPYADRVPAALTELRTREAVNDAVIDDLLTRAEVRA